MLVTRMMMMMLLLSLLFWAIDLFCIDEKLSLCSSSIQSINSTESAGGAPVLFNDRGSGGAGQIDDDVVIVVVVVVSLLVLMLMLLLLC